MPIFNASAHTHPHAAPPPTPRGVHGMLLEVLEVDERLRRAVEKTAGAALYHVVVSVGGGGSWIHALGHARCW